MFVFTNGIAQDLAEELESRGIAVEGKRLEDFGVGNHSLTTIIPQCDVKNSASVSDLSTEHSAYIKKINLDVSAMLAYVSSVTNGSCKLYEFSVPVLKQQAQWESERPQKPILDSFFQGAYFLIVYKHNYCVLLINIPTGLVY